MNRKGYKHTSLGWIPEDWAVKTIGDNCSRVMDGTHFSPSPKASGDYLYITSKNIRNDGLCLRDIEYISKVEHEPIYQRCPVKYGDILLTKDGANTGNCCINVLTEEFSLLSSVAVLRADDKNLMNTFLFQFIKSYMGQSIIRDAIGGQAITRITLEKIRSFSVVVPPLPEQRRIASILSSWDTAIAKEQQLINVLQTRHRGLMQQLLSGKKRLKGFKGEWKPAQIADVAAEVSLRNKDVKDIVVLSCTKYDGLVSSLEYFGRKIFSDDLSTYKVVPKYTFAYATNHIEEGSIGYQDSFNEGLVSPMYTVFKTNDSLVSDNFLFRLLKTHRYILEYRRRMEGSIDRRGGLRWDDFSKIMLLLPSLDEQMAIASVLEASDREIQLHRRRLAALQQQKKGLMQVLLTGKIRVKPKEE